MPSPSPPMPASASSYEIKNTSAHTTCNKRTSNTCTRAEMWSVTRRFSDFVQLRDVLCARYVVSRPPVVRVCWRTHAVGEERGCLRCIHADMCSLFVNAYMCMQGLFIPKLKRTRAELTLKNTVAALKVGISSLVSSLLCVCFAFGFCGSRCWPAPPHTRLIGCSCAKRATTNTSKTACVVRVCSVCVLC